MSASIIRENYSDDPLALESFIDKINLIEDLADDSLTNTLISFIKAKLEVKAREALPANINTVAEIKNALRSRIKPDNSKVVTGKIASLQVKSDNYADLSKQVEDLADALERLLIV